MIGLERRVKLDRRWRLGALLLMAAAWSSAGAHPLHEAIRDFTRPNDFTSDFVTAHAWIHQGRLGHAPRMEVAAANAYASSIGAPPVPLIGSYYIHPPPALLVAVAFVPLGYSAAAVAWAVLTLAALAWLARTLLALAGVPPGGWRWAAAWLLLALWPPVLHNLAKGQWSVLLAALIAAGVRDLLAAGARRTNRGGVWWGVAAGLKATPALLLGALVMRRSRAAVAMVVTGIVLALIATLAEGPQVWRAWMTAVPDHAAVWRGWTANTASVAGLCARTLPERAATPVTLAVTAALIAVAAWLTGRAGARAAGRPVEGPVMVLWLVLVVVCNPLAWSHSLLMLTPGFSLLGLTPLTAMAAVLMTIPRYALVFAARGLGPVVVSLHLAGALLLFAAAARRITAPAAKSAS